MQAKHPTPSLNIINTEVEVIKFSPDSLQNTQVPIAEAADQIQTSTPPAAHDLHLLFNCDQAVHHSMGEFSHFLLF